jgi:hypothetical protein
VSDEALERERFQKFMSNRRLVAPESPFVPRSWKDWVTHRLDMKEVGQKSMQERIQSREAYNRRQSRARIIPLLNGKTWKNNLGAVVAYETVFVPWYSQSDARIEPPWPSYEEFKHEGDDRERSKYKRQLPLPRKPGNVTVNWKQRQMQEPYEFYAPVDLRSPESRILVTTDPIMGHWVGESLFKELNK